MTSPKTDTSRLPSAFFYRKLHSFLGIFLVLYLIFHLLTNSQAALMFGDDAAGFIHDVNFIHSLPYLIVIEIFLLGVPFLIHMIWGVRYLLYAAPNSWRGDGTVPSLPEYGRNKAYTWQRITSWILLFAIIGHVVHMRILNYPTYAKIGEHHYYMNRFDIDSGIYTLAARLGVTLYDRSLVNQDHRLLEQGILPPHLLKSDQGVEVGQPPTNVREALVAQQKVQARAWLKALEERPLGPGQVMGISSDIGSVMLLMVREVFRDPTMMILYTIFVLAACFHAFNGLWTSLIVWGVTLSTRSMKQALVATKILMVLVAFLGLISIWGTYWLNLKT